MKNGEYFVSLLRESHKVMKKLFVILLGVLATMQVYAQDLSHYKRVVKELSSAKYQGRGYAKDGANKAGKFLKKEFTKAGPTVQVGHQHLPWQDETECGWQEASAWRRFHHA